MPVSFGTATTAAAYYGGSAADVNFNVNPPASLAAGDLWIITVTGDTTDSLGQDFPDFIGLPSGWTGITSAIWSGKYPAPVGWPFCRSMWKIAGASEAAVDVPIAAHGFSLYQFRGISRRYTGTHQTAPIGDVVTGAQAAEPADPATPDTDALTIDADGSMVDLVAIGYIDTGAGASATPPAGATLISEEWSNFCGNAAAYIARNSGSYDPTAWSVDGPARDVYHCRAQAFEIIPAGGGGGAQVQLMGRRRFVMP